MVKNLDSNLFLGDEIKEVYTEIMKTVPRDHLNCEQVKKTFSTSWILKILQDYP